MASKSSMQTDITQIEIQQAISRASIALNRNEKTHAQMAVGKYENMLIEATDSAKVKALFAADTTKTTEVKQRVYNAVVACESSIPSLQTDKSSLEAANLNLRGSGWYCGTGP